MDIVLRRCSPPTKQPAQRGRGNTLAMAETSSRSAEAALEPDASPHDMVRNGEGSQQGKDHQAQDLPHRSGEAPASGSGKQRQLAATDPKWPNPSGAREGSAIQAEQQLLQHPAGDQDDDVDGEDRPDGSPGSLEWLLRYSDLRNVSRIQQELLNQQQRQQQQQQQQQQRQQQQHRGRNGLGAEQESGIPAEAAPVGGPPPSSSLPEPPAAAPAPEQQQQGGPAGGGPQDGPQRGGTNGALGKEPTPAPVPAGRTALGSPQPLKVITQHQPQLLRQARATKTPSIGAEARKAATAGVGPTQLQQQQEGGGGAGERRGAGAGAGGGGRARLAGRDKAGERPQGGGGGAAGTIRRGRQSTEDELLFAANALELLANSGPGATGPASGAGGLGAPTASASQGPSAGFGGGAGSRRDVTTSGRAGGAAAAGAAARGEPSVSGRAAGGRGPMGGGGGSGRRRGGGGGRGMRVGGTGPRIIRGTVPDPDLDDGDEGGGRAAAGTTDSPGGDSRGRPRAGPGGGVRYRPGAGRYDGEEGGGGGSGSDGEERRRYAMYGAPYNDMPDDEAMFGPVPRRPRMSVMCAPTLYEEIVATNSPDLPVQVLLLSSGQLQRLVERQQQMRVAADAAAVAAARHQRLLQKQVSHQQHQHQHQRARQLQQQQQFAVAAVAAAQQHQGGGGGGVLPFGSVGGFGAQVLNQEILRRAILVQQQQRQQQQQQHGDWEAMGDDGRYGGPGAEPPRRGPAGGGGGHPAAPRGPPLQQQRQSGGDWQQEEDHPGLHDYDGLEGTEDLPPLRHTPPPYGRTYEEASAAAAAAAAAAQQQQQQQQALGSLVLRLGGFGRDGGGPQLPLHVLGSLHQQLPPLQLHPRHSHPHPDFPPPPPPGDGLGEGQPAPKRRGRPPKLRSQGPDFLQPPGSASASQFFDGGSGGAKRSLSPADGRGSMPYTSGGGGGGGGSGRASQQQIPYGYDNGGADLDLTDDPVIGPPLSYDGGGQRALRGGREDGADVALGPGRAPSGPRVGSGGGGGSAGGGGLAGGSAGAVRHRPSGSLQQGRPSFGNAPDSDLEVDVEELPPPPQQQQPATARAADGAGWQGSGRGGAAGPYGGRHSWQGGPFDEADDVDGGPYADQGQYRSSYDRPEPSGGGAAAAAAVPSKRQRLADGAPPLNGRSGGRGRGRGRHTSPGGGMGPGEPGGRGGSGGGGAPGSGAAALRPPPSQQELAAYEPVVEIRDVEEEDGGRSLSLSFLHSTLGTFAGSLKLITAE
ncbi:hypothetical protein PLESTB_001132400 [Pleodorina starrii]|uniref:Uncharacterized protein n=1 Tax=Pleodorina starrii TaxID=330485 RepID=A0A9W6BR19_9CHLO|nr:hypothetical protein PLESTM_001369800 [Pleodorina starrii]GLC56664.1 hypothetical protein PLESTB_001132400 [Pleodorina starrii]GLC69051.1 hypothetical protein PLESTF_000774300 [Pleodorina starrii]